MRSTDSESFFELLRSIHTARKLELTEPMAMIWFDVLGDFDFDAIRKAFSFHFATNSFVPMPADIRKILTAGNGQHLLPEQAWNHIPKDEYSGAYITEEMASALGAASDSLSRGDFIAARMAFIETYKAEVTKAELQNRPPKWFYSQASALDRQARAHLKIEKTMEAAERKWIAPTNALDVLNIICSEHGMSLDRYHARLQSLSATPLPLMITSSSESGKKRIAEVMSLLTNGKNAGKNESPESEVTNEK